MRFKTQCRAKTIAAAFGLALVADLAGADTTAAVSPGVNAAGPTATAEVRVAGCGESTGVPTHLG